MNLYAAKGAEIRLWSCDTMDTVLVLKKGDACLLNAEKEQWEINNLKFSKVKSINELMTEIQNKWFLLIILEMDSQNVECIQNLIILLRSMMTTPIVIVSDEAIDISVKVSMLNNGADQVYSLPITIDEATASIFSHIRRYTVLRDPISYATIIYSCGVLVNLDCRKVFVCGKKIELVKKEFEILSLLMRNHGKVLTHEVIICEIWNEDYPDSPKDALWTHIVRLRKKIRFSTRLPEYIKTVHGVGYSFDPQHLLLDKNDVHHLK